MRESFWKNGLSVDETKFSTLMILLLSFSGIAIYLIFEIGDIPVNLTNLLYALIAAVTGINAVKIGASYVKSKNENGNDTTLEMHTEFEYTQTNDLYDEVMNDEQETKEKLPI